MTPVSSLPICEARRMRWLSPPESVGRGAVERQVAEPHVDAGSRSRLRISLSSSSAIGASVPLQRQPVEQGAAPRAMVSARQLDDALAVHLHRAALGLEPLAAAGRAGLVGEEAHVVAGASPPTSVVLKRRHQLVDHALPLHRPRPPPHFTVNSCRPSREHDVALALARASPRGCRGRSRTRGRAARRTRRSSPRRAPCPLAQGSTAPVADGARRVGDDEVRVHLGAGARARCTPGTCRAGC